MSYVGEGQQNQVLTQTSLGPIWQDSVGVGVTVGSGVSATYINIGAAVTAGENIINVIGQTFEPSNITIPTSGLTIKIFNNVEVNLADARIVGANRPISIAGNGTLRYARTDTASVIQPRAEISDLQIINASSADAPISSDDLSKITNCNFTGDCVVSASGTQVHGCNIAGNLIIDAGSTGADISDVQIRDVVIDSGVATILSNVSFY